MNSSLLCSPKDPQISTLVRALALFALFLSMGAPLSGQPLQSSVESRKARSAVVGRIIVAANELAAEGDLDGAESALTGLSAAPTKTAEWHFDLALNLTQLASSLARSGNAQAVRPLVIRALRALEDADRLTSDLSLRAAIFQHIGFVQDRFIGDKEAAKRAYRSAVHSMRDGKSAKERLERMEDTETNSRLKADIR